MPLRFISLNKNKLSSAFRIFLYFCYRMKRFLSVALLQLYLLSSIGLVISLHYCGGNLASLKLFVPANCCCDDEVSDENQSCCKDEFKTIKLCDDQIKEEPSKIGYTWLEASFPCTIPSFKSCNLVNKLLALRPVILPRPPNEAEEIPAYKKNNAYLFYC
jgi:hypothetical protein